MNYSTRIFAALVLAVTFGSALVGCGTIQSDTQRIQTACVGVTTAVQTLTLHVDRLSTDQIAVIEKSLDVVTPICGEGGPPTSDTITLAAIQAVQNELTQLAQEVRK